MRYSKPPVSIEEQIILLKKRGLEIINEEEAIHSLSFISYYRLRAYTYPFQDNSDSDHTFVKEVSFQDIIQLYSFDAQLRILIFDSIEKIEIALRTQIIYNFALEYGAHWHLNPALYNNSVYFAQHIASLQKEIDRSNETFIKHYRDTYTFPQEPPSWMSLEVTSMGLLSKIFANLKNDKCKTKIVNNFGLKSVDVLENWMLCFSLLRNICAHHGRLWNRRMTRLTLPRKPIYPYLTDNNILDYKVYAYLTAIQYLLNIISPNHNFKTKLISLVKSCPLLQEKEMGFPKNWQNEKLWQ